MSGEVRRRAARETRRLHLRKCARLQENYYRRRRTALSKRSSYKLIEEDFLLEPETLAVSDRDGEPVTQLATRGVRRHREEIEARVCVG
jgi:hypothetical protein